MARYQTAPRSDRSQTTPVFVMKSSTLLEVFPLKRHGKQGTQGIVQKHKESATNTRCPMFSFVSGVSLFKGKQNVILKYQDIWRFKD